MIADLAPAPPVQEGRDREQAAAPQPEPASVSAARRREPVLAVTNIEVRYQGAILVLKNVSLTVGEGEIVALLGSNGAGKTTTLKSISSLIQSEEGRVTEGQISYRGERIENSDPTATVRKGLVQVMEGRRVLEHMTVEQNLVVASAPVKMTRAQLRAALDSVFDIFPVLGQFRHRQSGFLSGGQQQMLVIGRALMARPGLLLLDEPSLGLSPLLVTTIFQAIARINRELGTSILLVEQNAKVALNLAHRGYVLENGRVVMEGTREELLGNDDLQEFYLGIGSSGKRRNFKDIKQYRRRRRWLG